jgi:hypothetical protein
LKKGLRTTIQSGRGVKCAVIHWWPACLLLLLNGCINSAMPVVGAIQFVTSSGASATAVSSLAVNGTVYLVATVTQDSDLLGVSWTLSCGSLPPAASSEGIISTACGVISPTQTSSGPVPAYPSTGFITTYTAPSAIPKGNTVTITAHATSLPSVTSSVTLTIVEAGQSTSNPLTRPYEHLSNGAQRTGL